MNDTAILPTPTLRIEPGYGLTALIHDGYLQLEQSDEEGKKDTLMLSRFEARRLFEEFGGWANS